MVGLGEVGLGEVGWMKTFSLDQRMAVQDLVDELGTWDEGIAGVQIIKIKRVKKEFTFTSIKGSGHYWLLLKIVVSIKTNLVTRHGELLMV